MIIGEEKRQTGSKRHFKNREGQRRRGIPRTGKDREEEAFQGQGRTEEKRHSKDREGQKRRGILRTGKDRREETF